VVIVFDNSIVTMGNDGSELNVFIGNTKIFVEL